jgi:hypothetical protein
MVPIQGTGVKGMQQAQGTFRGPYQKKIQSSEFWKNSLPIIFDAAKLNMKD